MDTDQLLDTYYEHLRTRTAIALSQLATVSSAIVSLALDGVEDITIADVLRRADTVALPNVENSLIRLQALGFLTVAGNTPAGLPIYVLAPTLGLLAAADLEEDLVGRVTTGSDEWSA